MICHRVCIRHPHGNGGGEAGLAMVTKRFAMQALQSVQNNGKSGAQ